MLQISVCSIMIQEVIFCQINHKAAKHSCGPLFILKQINCIGKKGEFHYPFFYKGEQTFIEANYRYKPILNIKPIQYIYYVNCVNYEL